MSLISIVNRRTPLESITTGVSDTSASNVSVIEKIPSSSDYFIITDFNSENAKLKKFIPSSRSTTTYTSNYSFPRSFAIYDTRSVNNNMYVLVCNPGSGYSNIKVVRFNYSGAESVSEYNLLDNNGCNIASLFNHLKPSTTKLFFLSASTYRISNITLNIGSSPNFTLTASSSTSVNTNSNISKIFTSPTTELIYYYVTDSSFDEFHTIKLGGSDGSSFITVNNLPVGIVSANVTERIRNASFDPSGNIWLSTEISNSSTQTSTYSLKKYVFTDASNGSVTTTITLSGIPTNGFYITDSSGNGYYSVTANINFTIPIVNY